MSTQHNHLYLKLILSDTKYKEYANTGNSHIYAEHLHKLISNYLTPIQMITFNFPYGGHSGSIILGESHLNWHTYPENDYIVIDIYSCKEYDYISLIESICVNLGVTLMDKEYKLR